MHVNAYYSWILVKRFVKRWIVVWIVVYMDMFGICLLWNMDCNGSKSQHGWLQGPIIKVQHDRLKNIFPKPWFSYHWIHSWIWLVVSTNPSEKYESSWDDDILNTWEKHVPNHQPDMVSVVDFPVVPHGPSTGSCRKAIIPAPRGGVPLKVPEEMGGACRQGSKWQKTWADFIVKVRGFQFCC